jgi:hypothetical protein
MRYLTRKKEVKGLSRVFKRMKDIRTDLKNLPPDIILETICGMKEDLLPQKKDDEILIDGSHILAWLPNLSSTIFPHLTEGKILWQSEYSVWYLKDLLQHLPTEIETIRLLIIDDVSNKKEKPLLLVPKGDISLGAFCLAPRMYDDEDEISLPKTTEKVMPKEN